MCGIAGIIYRTGAHDIGKDMIAMLQSMKHRGPDSTGYALYGRSEPHRVVMRYKLADANDPRDFDFQARLSKHRDEVESRIGRAGGEIESVEAETEYAFRAVVHYHGDLKTLVDLVEDVPHAEVLSIGQLARDRRRTSATPRRWASSTGSTSSSARTRSATSGWRPSPTSTSRAPTPTGRTRSATSRSSTTGS